MNSSRPASIAIAVAAFLCLACVLPVGQCKTTSTKTVEPRPVKTETPKTETRKKPAAETYTVYKISLREDIMSEGVPFFIHRAVVAAKAAKADAVVLDLKTPGGRLDLMLQIRDDLITLKMPTYSFVNNEAISAGALVAIAMGKIVMSPISTIGGAQVITAMATSLDPIVEQKMNSILLSEVRATAKYRGHPVRICEAFVDRNIEIPGLTPKGSVLTMDQEQATTFKDPQTSKPLAAFIATDLDDLLKRENLWPARILSYEMTWSEKLAKYLMSIKAMLLLIGLGALFVEIKTPGVGVPGAIGVIALVLFFWSAYLADLADFLEVGLFIIGLVLLILEIFVIPGFGLAGVGGIFLIVLSLVLAMFKLPPPDVPGIGYNIGMLKTALLNVVIAFLAMIPLAWLVGRYLPSAPLFRQLVLLPDSAHGNAARQRKGKGAAPAPAPHEDSLIGAEGIAMTDLRPSGMAIINGKRFDVITEGDYIAKGDRVRITEVHGNVHVVVVAGTPADSNGKQESEDSTPKQNYEV